MQLQVMLNVLPFVVFSHQCAAKGESTSLAQGYNVHVTEFCSQVSVLYPLLTRWEREHF